ncbi:polyphenol oxidase family protein [Schaalia sp. lx-100]|uniref:polyphenol oxidase family protein n=1 Tax=Schaalia sp. lx-100 TaxID=2899081 RepID=UPI001E4213B3|nr:polyphenol oxidase family protein [Schaalia sp. lx-100]MCD4557056.1 polyphenol oxidase family protein [Schaalia sp. lx-100]
MTPVDTRGAVYCFTGAGYGTDPLRANYGLHVSDNEEKVHERRHHLADDLGRAIIWMNQVHGNQVAVFTCDDDLAKLRAPDSPYPMEYGPIVADAMIIDAREWKNAPAAAVMVADCMPILMSACGGSVVACVHAGRGGLLSGILTRTLSLMRDLSCQMEDVRVVIGPSACGSCYEVPASMRDQAVMTHPAAYSTTSWGTPAINLQAAACEEMRMCGIQEIFVEGICTIEEDTCHSHRRNPESGRQIGVIRPYYFGDIDDSPRVLTVLRSYPTTMAAAHL